MQCEEYNFQNLYLVVIYWTQFVLFSANGQYCGLAKSDPQKVCISVKLPWQEDPIYFCKEKESFKYRNYCATQTSGEYCNHNTEAGLLVIATPWDCCPLSSNPDICTDKQCPDKPFNRTCVEVQPKSEGECCAETICEDGLGSKSDCHLKTLEASCRKPTEGKTKCVAFIDKHGCCPKFQCKEDQKPGFCPVEKIALKFKSRMDNHNPLSTSEMKSSSDSRGQLIPRISEQTYFEGYEFNMLPQRNPDSHSTCVGDFNCPSNLKCCSSDIYVYSDGEYFDSSISPTYGFCELPEEL